MSEVQLDPDPYKNSMDPTHWMQQRGVLILLKLQILGPEKGIVDPAILTTNLCMKVPTQIKNL